ncbi:MAG: hypothetical protein HOM34_04210 [Planctomycetes bacterium]|jgi:hypothetical protein|nr:hypothetical protein [Planctomycetota bacterium]MBT4028546.1 hypothetical protein [Planctomycetota bacterium]MBT4559438.1 hypothetical protein [Planctomycetota bacterium]MBT5100999.1 hypothetical protein [Planctomycetota bacterium]MBT5119905.1 hypothetical protein [Planctomycetota bacterium]
MRIKTLLLAFSALLLASSCSAIIIAGAGAAVGLWAQDEYADDRGQVLLKHSAERVFAAAKAVAQEQAEEDLEIKVMKIQYSREGVEYIIQIFLMPKTPDYCELKVVARELYVRGRGDLAEYVADEITARL